MNFVKEVKAIADDSQKQMIEVFEDKHQALMKKLEEQQTNLVLYSNITIIQTFSTKN
jgi:hypothetical protein